MAVAIDEAPVLRSIFDIYQKEAYPITYRGKLVVSNLAGGVPADPKVAEGWIRSKVKDKEEVIRDLIAQYMVENKTTLDEATQAVDKTQHLNGFMRAKNGQLYIEGRQLKACLKEAGSVAVAAGKIEGGRAYGKTNKGLLSFFNEHVFVVEDRLYITQNDKPVFEPTGIVQRFVSTFRGTGIQYMEYVEGAMVEFTVITDWEFTARQWAMIWLTAQQEGLGASRSQGFGRFIVPAPDGWTRVKDEPKKK